MRAAPILALVIGCWCAQQAAAWDQQPDGYEVINGPGGPDTVAEWRRDWTAWKKMELLANRYDARDACNVYNLVEAQWTQRSFVQALVMLHDRAIYDRQTQTYTVDTYVQQLQTRVGVIDSVLLWPAYPNIGIDSRNQWDLLRDLPGGVSGVRGLIEDFHRHHIRVFIPYNPWDIGTRDEPGLEDTVRMYTADIATLNRLIPELQADGFNGDTMYGVPKSFFNCSAPLVAAPEGGVPTAFLSNNPMSWGYFLGYEHFPPVSRAKFLEPRHMVQVCARWSLDKTVDLQAAFFNGAGYVVWENVWGIWNAMTAREAETAKRMFKILRYFAFAVLSDKWEPYTALQSSSVFASAFPVQERGSWFYTVINTSPEGQTFELPLTTEQSGQEVRVYDVYHGLEMRKHSASNPSNQSMTTVRLALEPRGFGAIFVTKTSSVDDSLTRFLKEMQALAAKPLAKFSSKRGLLQQQLIRSKAEGAKPPRDHSQDEAMLRVTGTKNWWFNVSGVQIEPVAAWTPNAAQFGAGVQFPWELRPWNNHSVRLLVQDFWMDKHPVTNAQYARFLHDSGYRPKSLHRFLLHWNNRTTSTSEETEPSTWRVPQGQERSPVVHVAREDAEAFASFYGKRLPHDWEWQYVVSNGDRYDVFPWGSELDATRLPEVFRGKQTPLLEPVGSHSSSRSTAFEVEDLVGYVWQMTDQFCDVHTCGMLLRGGSSYRPVSATHSDPNWYFPQALEAQTHNRFLMLSEGYDRSAMVGFRCVASVVSTDPSLS
ncbi:hypothetical protein BBJ28_00000901 [Nothophytophthora sp. Chile5]|nr:hypothetical protein BBJ28_00000901 [Nothophytophthora sp. Chile5]